MLNRLNIVNEEKKDEKNCQSLTINIMYSMKNKLWEFILKIHRLYLMYNACCMKVCIEGLVGVNL